MIKKKSQFASAWPTIYNLIRELGLMQDLPPISKIKLDSSRPEKSEAFGFVTTEDSDDNGTLDTMHIVVPNVERYLSGVNTSELSKLKIEDPNRLKQILLPIVEIIAHEQGHIKDYKHGDDNPFPGGENVADQAANQILNRISAQATNNINKNDIFNRSLVMKKDVVARLVRLASDLDQKKAFDLSDKVASLAAKFAQEMPLSGRKFQFADWVSSDVPFSWGSWKGATPGESYYVASDRPSDSLGSVQFPGDPYTYEPAGKGRLKVVSGPERGRAAIGSVIADPRFKPTTKPPEQAPQTPGAVSVGDPNKELESRLGKLDSDIRSEGEKLSKIDRFVESALNTNDKGRVILNAYKSQPGYDQRAQLLQKNLNYLKAEGFDVKTISDAIAKINSIYPTYSQLVMERRSLRQNKADDMEADAESCADDLDSDGLEPEELNKDASFNAIFWNKNSKTPFGR